MTAIGAQNIGTKDWLYAGKPDVAAISRLSVKMSCMPYLFTVAMLILSSISSYGQLLPDSLSHTQIAQLNEGDTLTVYSRWKNCRGGSASRFYITKSNNSYSLIASAPVSMFELKRKHGTYEAFHCPETIEFPSLGVYPLSDSNVVAWASIEYFGNDEYCQLQTDGHPRVYEIYSMKIGNQLREFYARCEPAAYFYDERLNYMAVPQKCHEDIEEYEVSLMFGTD